MKNGFTTGSCSAAAAKAAAYMLLSGNVKNKISINTPAGIKYEPAIEDINIASDFVSCAVRKDSGDDPDVTNGCLIYATVSYEKNNSSNERVIIDGGVGIGRVTKVGLDQPVGAAAINSVPRKMIAGEVLEVMELFDYEGALKVIISVPDGEKIAGQTFNPRLGINGGISIIGTSGIVEPMSTKAIIDTIKVELNQKFQEGNKLAIVSPGNYGLDFMKKQYAFDLDKAVKCSNFIGDTIDIARELGFEKMLLVGHLGKLIKVTGGIMNTHSKEADCRMELMAALALKAGINEKTAIKILDCLTTEEAYQIIINEKEQNIIKQFSKCLMDKISFYLNKRGNGLEIECIVYTNEFGLIGTTKAAEALIKNKGNGYK